MITLAHYTGVIIPDNRAYADDDAVDDAGKVIVLRLFDVISLFLENFYPFIRVFCSSPTVILKEFEQNIRQVFLHINKWRV